MPTLQQYRQALASSDDLGGYVPFTSTSASATSTATQEIICTALMDDTTNVSSRFAGSWVLGVAGGSSEARLGDQRRVRQYGFDGTTGTLTVTRVFGATPASGHKWELYFRIPAIRDEQGEEGYREIINTALSRMAVPGFITLSAVTDTRRYTLNLGSYPWLRERGRILSLRNTPADTTERRLVEPQHWSLTLNNETAEFELRNPYTTGTSIDIEVLRPANSRIKSSGAWQDQSSPTAGLTNDADEAIPTINAVVAVAREIAFTQLAKRGPEAETRLWLAKAADAGRAAADFKFSASEDDGDPLYPLNISSNVDYSVWR